MSEQLALFEKAPYYQPLIISVTVDSFFSDYNLIMTEYLTDLYERWQSSQDDDEENEFLNEVLYHLTDDIIGDMHISDWEVKRSGRR